MLFRSFALYFLLKSGSGVKREGRGKKKERRQAPLATDTLHLSVFAFNLLCATPSAFNSTSK